MSNERNVEPRIVMAVIKNATRSSVSFRVPGRSVHLQPGQSAEVPRAYLETAELKALCRQGALLELPAEAAPPGAGPSADRGAEREGGDHAGARAPNVEGSKER